jgi:hypothetical protein
MEVETIRRQAVTCPVSVIARGGLVVFETMRIGGKRHVEPTDH